ncbi:MAG: ArsR family transcriptional regulator [Thermomicrobiales bacterium]
MAGKKSKSDIESIRGELTELTEAIYSLREQVRMESAAVAAATGIDTASAPSRPASIPAGEPLGEGEIVSRGSVRLTGAGAGQTDLAVEWSSADLDVARLAGQASDDLAKTLAAIGHRQRLAILLAILSGPKSAADLVGTLGLGTTGAAYHHLNVLLGAGLVVQAERGIYTIAPDRVAMVLTVLASPLVHATVTGVATPEEAPAKPRRARKGAA